MYAHINRHLGGLQALGADLRDRILRGPSKNLGQTSNGRN